MLPKTVLGFLGMLMLIMGISCIVVATLYSKWEDKEYKQLKNKDAPKNLKNTTMIVGVVSSVVGALLAIWAGYIHMYPRRAAKNGLAMCGY